VVLREAALVRGFIAGTLSSFNVLYCIFPGFDFLYCTIVLGVRGGAVGLSTALQTGRSRVPFPMVSLEFFIDIILRPHYGRGVDSASNRNEYQEYFLGVKAAGA